MAKSRANFRALIDEIIGNFDRLPDSAVIPSAATARLLSVSVKTVRRNFPTVQISPGRTGQRVGEVRAISQKPRG